MAASGMPPLHMVPVAEARQMLLAFNRALGGEPEPVGQILDREIPGPQGSIPVRLYTPAGGGPLPALVFFHGGGWVLGNIEAYDTVCRALTNAAGCAVLSVDYRLAPEHKFPAAVEDCYAATRWVVANAATLNLDPARIAVGGDSAGGNLAAVIAQVARDRGGPSLVFQLLVYPVTDYLPDLPSYAENAEGYLLTKDAMGWVWNHYLLHEAEGKNPLASPLRAADLSGLPPALIITAERDPLRDEGERYATRLQEAGVPVAVTRYDGMIHGFFSMAGMIDQGKQALAQAGAALHSAFARASGHSG
jgi:acetyl esterase